AYLPALSDAQQPWSDPIEFLAQAIASGRDLEEQAKALETTLRAANVRSLARLASVLEASFARHQGGALRLVGLFRAVFNGVALSPYTQFADALVGLIVDLADAKWFGPPRALDVLGYMLRNLCRHLTAFDLTLFHNFGANYPDALFLEALLAAYLTLTERNPELIFKAGPAPGVDRLVIVADYAEISRFLGQDLDQPVLSQRGILKLIHHDISVALAIELAYFGKLFHQPGRLNNKVVEVHGIEKLEPLGIFGKEISILLAVLIPGCAGLDSGKNIAQALGVQAVPRKSHVPGGFCCKSNSPAEIKKVLVVNIVCGV
ncbi:hypothetical protein LCGC14_2912820, partial [marine sediment metagenome]